jgi:hypothetical protein
MGFERDVGFHSDSASKSELKDEVLVIIKIYFLDSESSFCIYVEQRYSY